MVIGLGESADDMQITVHVHQIFRRKISNFAQSALRQMRADLNAASTLLTTSLAATGEEMNLVVKLSMQGFACSHRRKLLKTPRNH